MANIQTFPVISNDDGILFTQDENNNIAVSVDETVTTQGNEFNGASQLVKLDEYGALPAVDGSNLTGIAVDDCADTNLSNLTSTGKSVISNLAMPSSSYDNLTLGTSGSIYTAPADGYYFVWKLSGAETNGYIIMNNLTSSLVRRSIIPFSSSNCYLDIPVRSGDEVQIGYNLTGVTQAFKFIYAEGSVV